MLLVCIYIYVWAFIHIRVAECGSESEKIYFRFVCSRASTAYKHTCLIIKWNRFPRRHKQFIIKIYPHVHFVSAYKCQSVW